MPITNKTIGFLLAPALFALGAPGADTITVNSGRPVADAARKLELRYNWAITYEDPLSTYEGDLVDVNAAKRVGRPEVKVLMIPRDVSFSFTLEDRARTSEDRPRTTIRSLETTAREAILTMLRSYSASLGGVETFTLTDSNGLFHIVPIRARNAAGVFETFTPILDRTVSIPPGQRTGMALVRQICQSLSEQSGVKVALSGGTNLLNQHVTAIASTQNERARSILSRLFAELRRPASWEVRYGLLGGSGMYVLNLYLVDPSR